MYTYRTQKNRILLNNQDVITVLGKKMEGQVGLGF